MALTLLLAGCGGGGGGAPATPPPPPPITEPIEVAAVLQSGSGDPVMFSLLVPTDGRELTTTVEISFDGETLTLDVIARRRSSDTAPVPARIIIPSAVAGGQPLTANITFSPSGAGQTGLSGTAPIPPIAVAAVLTPASGGGEPITVSLAIPIDSRIEPLTVAVQIPPSGRLTAVLMATVVITPPADSGDSVTAQVIIPSGGSAPAATSTLVIPVGGVPAAPGMVLLIPPDTAGGKVLTASIMFSPFDDMGRITLTIAAEPLEPVMVAAVLASGRDGVDPVSVSLPIPIDPYSEPLTMAVQIPPSGRLIEALMATVVIMPPDDPAHSVTARVIIPSGGSAPAATSTLVIPAGRVPAVPGTVLLIPPDTAGGKVLTASIMFSPFDDMGRITLTITAPALPRLTPEAIHAYAQALPQTYFYADLTLDAASLTVSLYTKQLQYGVSLVGAHRLHWSRLKPLGEISGEEFGERSSDYIRGAGVTVGIVDSGIDINHPDLRDNVLTVTNSGVELKNIEDEAGHGTQVAGIIAASLNADDADNSGIVGVAPEAKLLAVNFFGKTDSVRLNTAYDYMTANNAFVVNNSWGLLNRVVLVSVGADALYDIGSGRFSDPGRYWLRMPWQFYLDTTDRGTLVVPWLVFPSKIIDIDRRYEVLRQVATRTSPEEAMLLVFSAGNDGWNSETGEVYYCSEPSGNTCPLGAVNISLSNFNTLTVYGAAHYEIEGDEPGKYTITLHSISRNIQGGSVTVSISKNELDMVARMPVDYPTVASVWINVVNVDSRRRISKGSNGCGVTQERCLAAPGTDITTTAREGGLTVKSGTSFAAPHVSGAAALLKGAFPNLTPWQVGDILLESADGMGKCEDVDKKIPCFEPVYGHGILNITAAFTPTSFIRFAAEPSAPDSSRGDSGAVAVVKDGFNIAASRIRLSPAFGAAPWRRESLALGGVDNYGRVFYTHLDLSGGVVVSKPLVGEDQEAKGAAVHRAYAPPLSQPLAAATYIAADELDSAQWRESFAGVSYGGSQSPHRQSHFISSHLGSSRLGWHTRSGNGGLALSSASYWQAPFDSGDVHQLQWDYPLAAPSAPQVGVMLGGGDGVRQTAARLQWQWSDWALSAEGGVVREDSRVLGASFTGGFSLKGTETRYRRLRGVYQPADGLRLFADYVQSDSAADGDGGIVQRFNARADAWQAGLSYGRWRFIVSQPLAVTSGGLDLSYISGYTAAGDYAVTRKRLDLSSGQRARRASLLYEREAIDGLGFVLGLDVWRHAPARGYAGDAVAVSGALRYRF